MCHRRVFLQVHACVLITTRIGSLSQNNKQTSSEGIFTPNTFDTKQLLHQTIFRPEAFYSRNHLYTPDTLSPEVVFIPTCFSPTVYTRRLLHQKTFTPEDFYTGRLLHQKTLAPNSFYTRRCLHHQTTLNSFYTRIVVHCRYIKTFTPNKSYRMHPCYQSFWHRGNPVLDDTFTRRPKPSCFCSGQPQDKKKYQKIRRGTGRE